MLGISWGIISVVTLLAYGNGFGAALQAGFHGAFSEGVSVVFPGQTSSQVGGERAGRRIRVKPSDIDSIRELPLIKAASPEYMRDAPIVYGNKQSSFMVRAVDAAYGAMRSETPLPGGRFIDDEDVRLRRQIGRAHV